MTRSRLAAHRWGVVLVLVALLVTSGCQYRFAIVGDSVPFGARDQIAQRKGYSLSYPGLTISRGRPGLRRLAAQGHEVVVVALGGIDVAREVPLGQLRRQVRLALRDDLRGVPCVIWMTLNRDFNVFAGWPTRAAAFNRMLRRVAGANRRPVAQWHVPASRHPGWFIEDGVHLSPSGKRAYARFVARNVRRLC